MPQNMVIYIDGLWVFLFVLFLGVSCSVSVRPSQISTMLLFSNRVIFFKVSMSK